MKRYEIKLKLLTPCISRGGDEQKAEFRAPSIRGALRHWFRVLGGTKDDEKKIFGGLGAAPQDGRASKIVVRVKEEPEDRKRGTPEDKDLAGKKNDYFLGLWKAEDEKAYFPRGQTAEIEIIDKDGSPEFEAALKAFLYLGAIGSRSRRTYGSVFPETVSCNGEQWADVPKNLDDLKKYLESSGLKNAVVLAWGNKGDARSAQQTAQDFLKTFRCGSEKSGEPSFWGKREHDFIRGVNDGDCAYRAALGLPLQQKYSNGRGNFSFSVVAGTGKTTTRWASPLYLKVVPDGEKRYAAIAIFLKDYFIPEGWSIRRFGSGGSRELRLSHDLINAMMDQTNPMHARSERPMLLYQA